MTTPQIIGLLVFICWFIILPIWLVRDHKREQRRLRDKAYQARDRSLCDKWHHPDHYEY